MICEEAAKETAGCSHSHCLPRPRRNYLLINLVIVCGDEDEDDSNPLEAYYVALVN